MNPETTKITTKTYYVCPTCSEKMESMSVGGSSSELFGFGSVSNKVLYCNKKECEKFGFLTVAGIKREE